MAKTVSSYWDELRGTRVWRSVFRSGIGSSTLKRSLAIQQNVFLHLLPTKVRTDRKSTRLNSSHLRLSRMPSSA